MTDFSFTLPGKPGRAGLIAAFPFWVPLSRHHEEHAHPGLPCTEWGNEEAVECYVANTVHFSVDQKTLAPHYPDRTSAGELPGL